MTPIASLPMWSTLVGCRSCYIHVYETSCNVELRAHGQSVITHEAVTLDAAFEHAEKLKEAYDANPRKRRRDRSAQLLSAAA